MLPGWTGGQGERSLPSLIENSHHNRFTHRIIQTNVIPKGADHHRWFTSRVVCTNVIPKGQVFISLQQGHLSRTNSQCRDNPCVAALVLTHFSLAHFFMCMCPRRFAFPIATLILILARSISKSEMATVQQV